METLADFGTVAYFEVRTFVTGIYRAWYALLIPAASAPLALCLLGLVLLVLVAERLTRGAAQFSHNTTHIFKKQEVELRGAMGWAMTAACALPLIMGFVLPALALFWRATDEGKERTVARV